MLSLNEKKRKKYKYQKLFQFVSLFPTCRAISPRTSDDVWTLSMLQWLESDTWSEPESSLLRVCNCFSDTNFSCTPSNSEQYRIQLGFTIQLNRCSSDCYNERDWEKAKVLQAKWCVISPDHPPPFLTLSPVWPHFSQLFATLSSAQGRPCTHKTTKIKGEISNLGILPLTITIFVLFLLQNLKSFANVSMWPFRSSAVTLYWQWGLTNLEMSPQWRNARIVSTLPLISWFF